MPFLKIILLSHILHEYNFVHQYNVFHFFYVFFIIGYILHHRLEDHKWQETHLNGDRTVYTLRDLQCGSTYYIYIVAFNSVSQGNSSEIISAKTNGNGKYKIYIIHFISIKRKLNL